MYKLKETPFTPAQCKPNASAGDFLYIPLTEFILGENDKLENATIVASYNSMQDLVADGWVLD